MECCDQKLLDLLQEGKVVEMRGVGNSMRPLLRDGLDYALLTKVDASEIRKGDVVLYRKDQKWILHRVYRVYDREFDMLGDGNTEIEKHILAEQIVARAIGFERKGHYFPVGAWRYQCYWKIWIRFRRSRPLIKKINIIIKKKFHFYEDEKELSKSRK